MRVVGFLLTGLFLASCSTNGLLNPSPEEADRNLQNRNTTLRVAMDCFHRNIVRVDDGKQDILTVAVSVEGLCIPEWNNSVLAYAEGLPLGVRSSFYAKMRADELPMVAGLIQQERSNRR